MTKVAIVANQGPDTAVLNQFIIYWQANITSTKIIEFGDFRKEATGPCYRPLHRYSEHLEEVLFMGVHRAFGGFYTDWRTSKLRKWCKSFRTKPTSTVILYWKSHYLYGWATGTRFLALNESTIKRGAAPPWWQMFISG